MGHSHQFSCPIEIRLIEKRSDRVNHLKNLIKAKKATLVGNANLVIPDPIEGDCEQEVRNLVTACVRSGQPLGPAFFFLDQFGYSSFSMDLVNTILRHDICEVFSYLNWNLLHPFMSDPTKQAGITKASVAMSGDRSSASAVRRRRTDSARSTWTLCGSAVVRSTRTRSRCATRITG